MVGSGHTLDTPNLQRITVSDIKLNSTHNRSISIQKFQITHFDLILTIKSVHIYTHRIQMISLYALILNAVAMAINAVKAKEMEDVQIIGLGL